MAEGGEADEALDVWARGSDVVDVDGVHGYYLVFMKYKNTLSMAVKWCQ